MGGGGEHEHTRGIGRTVTIISNGAGIAITSLSNLYVLLLYLVYAGTTCFASFHPSYTMVYLVYLSFLVSLAALTPFVAAQSPDTAIELEAIEAHFRAAGLVPDLLPTFVPSALLSLTYAGVGGVSPGQALTEARERCLSLRDELY
jgi:hypothetical protein